MAGRRILLLGGTADARALASLLVKAGADLVSSLAGRTESPILPEGPVRVGGFGGVQGLTDYVKAEKIGLIADCTHPFASVISAHAAEAASACGIEYVRLERPAWEKGPGDNWITVNCMGAASDALLPGARVMLTTGLKDLPAFFSRPDISGIARMMGAPAVQAPAGWKIFRERPPFTLQREMALMREEKITVLVTKNAGGIARHKLDAARGLGLPVVMIARPAKPPARVAGSAEEMLSFLRL